MEYISEPMTMLTDYILGAFAFVYGVVLLHLADKQKTRRYWSFAFFALALSAILGGTYHGFFEILNPFQKTFLWKSTLILTGSVSLLLLLACAVATVKKKIQKIIVIFGIVKLLVFIGVIIFSNQFMLVIADYGLSLVIVTGLYIFGVNSAVTTAARNYIVIGVLISFIAAGVQLSGLTIHQHFNHNDLYHVIQIISLYYFYKGARYLTDVRH
jgi:hypothetical protein